MAARSCTTTQDHGLEKALDVTIIEQAQPAILRGEPVAIELPISNVNRTVGTMTGFEVTTRWGANGLPDDTISVTLTGSAGNSLGAFMPKGITLDLTGDANDYVGKGLSGGKIIVQAPVDAAYEPEDNVIAGNVCLYGATGGEGVLPGPRRRTVLRQELGRGCRGRRRGRPRVRVHDRRSCRDSRLGRP